MKKELGNLIGMEMDIIELDNKMTKEGFLTEANSGVFESCIQDGNIVYSEVTDDFGNTEPTTQVFFDIINQASEEEVIEASTLKITSIEKF